MLIQDGALIQNGASADYSCDQYWANTVFLCHFDGTNNQTGIYTDNSAGGTIIQPLGTAALSTAQKVYGTSSLYCDGSSYVKPLYPSGNSPSYDLGTVSSSTNMTVEFYMRKTTVTSPYTGLVCHALPGSGGNGVGGWAVYTTTNGLLGFAASKNSSAGTGWYAAWQTTSTVINSTSTWYYIAVVIYNGVPKIFVDGVEQAGAWVTGSSAYASSIIGFNTTKTNYGLIVGAVDSDSTNSVNSYYTGYIDELRVTMNTARYTSNFTAPTLPFPNEMCYCDPNYANVSLLLPMNGANNSTTFTDYSPSPKTLTRNGDPKISTVQFKWNGSSGYFDGVGDYLTTPSNIAYTFGTSDFTIEAWIYPTAAWSTYNAIFYTQQTNGVFFGKITGGLGLRATSVSDLVSTPAPAINNWVHLAVSRQGTNLRVFVNGILGSTVTNSTNFATGSASVAADTTGGNAFTGYINDLRVTKGVARYTSDFRVPPAPFPPTAC